MPAVPSHHPHRHPRHQRAASDTLDLLLPGGLPPTFSSAPLELSPTELSAASAAGNSLLPPKAPMPPPSDLERRRSRLAQGGITFPPAAAPVSTVQVRLG
jgi:hypothetical protein